MATAATPPLEQAVRDEAVARNMATLVKVKTPRTRWAWSAVAQAKSLLEAVVGERLVRTGGLPRLASGRGPRAPLADIDFEQGRRWARHAITNLCRQVSWSAGAPSVRTGRTGGTSSKAYAGRQTRGPVTLPMHGRLHQSW
jgi:hypothetical protein